VKWAKVGPFPFFEYSFESYNSTDDLYEQIIRVAFIQILHTLIMTNQDNQKPAWEEVQGLSWIFYED